MHKTLALAATLLVISTAAALVGAYAGVEHARTAAVSTGFFAHNGQLYQVTGIRPRGE